jgi:hypothetical protein
MLEEADYVAESVAALLPPEAASMSRAAKAYAEALAKSPAGALVTNITTKSKTASKSIYANSSAKSPRSSSSAPVPKAASPMHGAASGTEKASAAIISQGGANASAAFKRRGPGRPSTKPPAPPLEKKGIVDAPKDCNNRLEFVYDDPMVFKQLFSYFKNIKARDIHLRCARDGLTFFTRDHQKTSRVIAVVAGSQVNWHYVEQEFWLGINRENVEKMFGAIDKSFYKITMYQSHDDTGSLSFVFKDAEIDKDCNYKVTLSAFERDELLLAAERDLEPDALANWYPVSFTLSAKQFKKSVSDASNYSDTITYEKIGTQPLQLTYAKPAMIYNEVYRNDEKIQLVSAVPAGRTFRATIAIDNVKSLASSMVTDDARIYCREDADILFRSAIDAKALVVSTLTKLT